MAGPTRICHACKQRLPAAAFAGNLARKCDDCKTAPPPPRLCHRCGQTRPADEFVTRGRCCATCRQTPTPREHARYNRPRACLHCLEVQPAEAFGWGPGRGSGQYKRRRQICLTCEAREAQQRAERAEQRRATWEQDGVLVRRCSHCREIKPLYTGFHRGRAHNDSPSAWQYRCKPCQAQHVLEIKRRMRRDDAQREREREWKRRWRQRNPERARELQRAYGQRVRADPERHAARLEADRIAYRLRRERQDGVPLDEIRSIKTRGPVPQQPGQRIPTLPLAAIVDRALATATDPAALYDTIGVHERIVYAWRVGSRPDTSPEQADRVMVALGRFWWEVFDETTVRRPLLAVRSYVPRHKPGHHGRVLRYYELQRTARYGDAGPDTAALTAILHAFGDPADIDQAAAA